MDNEEMKTLVIDAMSDFYNKMEKERFDRLDKSMEAIKFDITDLKISHDALVKIVDYSKLQAKVVELERKLNEFSDFEKRISKLEKRPRRMLKGNK